MDNDNLIYKIAKFFIIVIGFMYAWTHIGLELDGILFIIASGVIVIEEFGMIIKKVMEFIGR